MTARAVHVQHAYEHERIRETLARVQELNARAAANKHQHIRVNHWVRKLLDQPVSNPAWLKNVSEHAATLLQMLLDEKAGEGRSVWPEQQSKPEADGDAGLVLRQLQVIDEPFLKMPPQGPLPTLPRHKVARLTSQHGVNGNARKRTTGRGAVAVRPSAQLLRRLLEDAGVDDAPEKKKVVTESKMIQTSDQDDQWDWQRVWKGAFEKMRSELLDRTAQIQSMSAEMKELRALVTAQKHALEQQESVREELVMKHRAETDNLRNVHALELEALKAKHKKQLEQTSLQNEALLRDRRREKDLGGAFNMQSESYGDFLAYIDDFYADTLKLTQSA